MTQIPGCLLIESFVTFNFFVTLLSASTFLNFSFEENRRECLMSTILDCCSTKSQSTPNFFQVCQRARRALQTFRCFRTLATLRTFRGFRTLARTSSQVRPITMLGRHRCPTCKIHIVSIRKQKFF